MAYSECFVCGAEADKQLGRELITSFYECPVCGRYALDVNNILEGFNFNHLSSYLCYNGFRYNINEYRYYTTMSKEYCDKYTEEFNSGITKNGHPIRLEMDNVENWYPKTFSEKIDYFLLYMDSKIKHMGETIILSKEEMLSSLFVDRYKNCKGKKELRTDDEKKTQADYMINYFIDKKLIISPKSWSGGQYDRPIQIAPDGYARIDILQKNSGYGKNVLVAMKFGNDTNELREAIRQGIKEAQYNPIFIDEVQHNDFITPELLKYIKDSKFVVVDLSHQNNGAYFEEGYAMGLGKPVIQLCKKDVQLHFDISQKNTIIWETEQEIPERLKNRIKATID